MYANLDNTMPPNPWMMQHSHKLLRFLRKSFAHVEDKENNKDDPALLLDLSRYILFICSSPLFSSFFAAWLHGCLRCRSGQQRGDRKLWLCCRARLGCGSRYIPGRNVDKGRGHRRAGH